MLSALALAATQASAQSSHDAFDKPLGYDTGREERAAHNYLNQTGREDSYGDSQTEANQWNGQNPNNYGTTANSTRANNQNRRMDQNDDDAQHHGSLGISMREDDGRVTVIAVMPGSPAAKAGLRVGDQIRFVGDQRIATAQGLADEVAEYRPGSRVDLAIRRNGEKQTVSVTLGSRQSWAGQQDRFNQNAHNANPPMDRQANRQLQDGNRRLYSYNNGRQQNEQSQQQLANRVSTLQQQLSQLQQELNSVRAQLNQAQNSGQEVNQGQSARMTERSASRNAD